MIFTGIILIHRSVVKATHSYQLDTCSLPLSLTLVTACIRKAKTASVLSAIHRLLVQQIVKQSRQKSSVHHKEDFLVLVDHTPDFGCHSTIKTSQQVIELLLQNPKLNAPKRAIRTTQFSSTTNIKNQLVLKWWVRILIALFLLSTIIRR